MCDFPPQRFTLCVCFCCTNYAYVFPKKKRKWEGLTSPLKIAKQLSNELVNLLFFSTQNKDALRHYLIKIAFWILQDWIFDVPSLLMCLKVISSPTVHRLPKLVLGQLQHMHCHWEIFSLLATLVSHLSKTSVVLPAWPNPFCRNELGKWKTASPRIWHQCLIGFLPYKQ